MKARNFWWTMLMAVWIIATFVIVAHIVNKIDCASRGGEYVRVAGSPDCVMP